MEKSRNSKEQETAKIYKGVAETVTDKAISAACLFLESRCWLTQITLHLVIFEDFTADDTVIY